MTSGFESQRKGTFKLTFDSGTQISVIWNGGSYTENQRDMSNIIDTDPFKPWISATAEVMVLEDPTGKMMGYMQTFHGGNNPVGWLSVDEVMPLLLYAWQIKKPEQEYSNE